MTSDELGFDTVHKPGALTRYFAERWLEEPSAEGEQLIAWLLESALGRNALYFIEKTKEYVDAWGGRGEIVPENAFDGFVITGDPVEEAIIPHAMLVWTCMNDRPWSEEVYHRWLDTLLAAGSAEAAYLAASLWPAHDLMAKVTYRPPGWLVYRGQLDAEAERLILVEMLKGASEPTTSLYGPFEYDDDVTYLKKLPQQYIKKHGFTHPICGLVEFVDLEYGSEVQNRIKEALDAPSWSEGVKGAAMLLYLSLNAFNDFSAHLQELFNALNKNLFKLDERYINIINFHTDKIEKINYNLIKDYINYFIILYNKIINNINLAEKMFIKYISIGLGTNEMLYIGEDIRDIIFKLILKEKVGPWLEKQADDLRIRDILLSTYMSKKGYYAKIDEELKIEDLEKKIEDIYGKIKYFEKIILLIDQARKYFTTDMELYKICNFINDILKREEKTNFNRNFIEDYKKIINNWHPKRRYFSTKDMFLESYHIGLYLYYKILKEWERTPTDFIGHIQEEKEAKVYLGVIDKINKNLYGEKMFSIETRLNSCLNKIENNNFPQEEIKYKFIMELINIIENYYDIMPEYFKDKRKLIAARKAILSNISLVKDKLRNPRLTGLLGIDNKSQNTIIY